MPRYPARRIILTGAFESGKTTLLLLLVDALRESRLDIAGVISPPVYKNGEKTGIDLLNLRDGTRQPLALLREGETMGMLFTNRWVFSTEAMEEGNRILLDATPCDLLIVDELGPLELERQSGWVNGINAIDSQQYCLAVCVIRESLVPAALQRWPDARVIAMTRETQSAQLEEFKNLALDLLGQKQAPG